MSEKMKVLSKKDFSNNNAILNKCSEIHSKINNLYIRAERVLYLSLVDAFTFKIYVDSDILRKLPLRFDLLNSTLPDSEWTIGDEPKEYKLSTLYSLYLILVKIYNIITPYYIPSTSTEINNNLVKAHKVMTLNFKY